MSAKSKTARRDEKQLSSPYVKIIIGSSAGCVLCFILIALAAVMALKSGLSSSVYMPLGMFFGALSAFLGGFIAVRPIKQRGALYGALSGLLQSLICSVILFVANGYTAGNGIFILSAIIILCSALGGIAAVNLKIKKRY